MEPPAQALPDPAQQQQLARFWASNRESAHRALVARSRFHDALEGFDWRVDVQAAAMGEQAQRNEATAIVEMSAGAQARRTKEELDDFSF